ncbi:hypothetical protein Q8W40_11495 [Vibrio penaeicida]|uniref:hypothetical protein n=1 Tax=Vibrio penaeicida TaxID=104609 RepID=UPI002732E68B|nr:hypothetical protein [Vibrio penaeicida]MDP2572810.1 hypothetical protein [Vibrio penaeicida]
MKEQPPQFSSNEHHSSNKHSPNEVRTIAALVIIAAFLPTVLMMAPAIASQLATEFQFGPAQIKIDHQGQLMNSTNLVIGGGLPLAQRYLVTFLSRGTLSII